MNTNPIEVYPLKNGGFLIIKRETYPSGFTNHRIQIEPFEKGGVLGWCRNSLKPFEQDVFFTSAHELKSDLEQLSKSGDLYIEVCAVAALEQLRSK